jgi:RPA family protein
MNAREVAWRVFAEEYNSSVLEHKGEGEKPVSYVVTPLGARVNRMLVVGVVTDVEDVGEQDKPMYRARITDPTGTFYVSAGQYQPEAAASLSKIAPPAFAAVVGKSRAYSPEEGVKYLSVRPETIREVDAAARDYWVVETAKSTLLRIDAVEDGLKMAQPSAAELVKLGYPQNLAEGVVQAIEYYKDIDLDRFRGSVREALRSILPEAGEHRMATPAKPAKKEAPRPKAEEPEKSEHKEGKVSAEEEEAVLEMISGLDKGGRGAPWDKLVEVARAKKVDKVRLEEIVGSLLDKGEIYEPELGMMKRI